MCLGCLRGLCFDFDCLMSVCCDCVFMVDLIRLIVLFMNCFFTCYWFVIDCLV